jgi:DNA-binding response OmpR family regulator
MKILLVDDDPLVVKTLAAILDDKGYDFIATSDAKSALDIALGEMPSLCIVDVLMPGLSGMELIAALRRGGYAGKILAISGGGRGHHFEVLDPALIFGADAALKKPFLVQSLVDEVEHLISCQLGSSQFFRGFLKKG